MTEFELSMSGGEWCHGLGSFSLGSAGAGDRAAFALPGDRPVWGRNRPLKMEHLRLEFSFDLKKRQLKGLASLTFSPRATPVREAIFDAFDLDVSAVTDEGGKPLKFTAGDRTLQVDLGRAKKPGQSTT